MHKEAVHRANEVAGFCWPPKCWGTFVTMFPRNFRLVKALRASHFFHDECKADGDQLLLSFKCDHSMRNDPVHNLSLD
eukprot:2541893-Amphidinium_carterae.1